MLHTRSSSHHYIQHHNAPDTPTGKNSELNNRPPTCARHTSAYITLLEGNDHDDNVRISLAIGLYGEKQVSHSRTADLTEKSLEKFIDLLRSKHIPWMEYTESSLNDDKPAIKELSGEYDGKQE